MICCGGLWYRRRGGRGRRRRRGRDGDVAGGSSKEIEIGVGGEGSRREGRWSLVGDRNSYPTSAASETRRARRARRKLRSLAQRLEVRLALDECSNGVQRPATCSFDSGASEHRWPCKRVRPSFFLLSSSPFSSPIVASRRK
jgi:hypothetical protein